MHAWPIDPSIAGSDLLFSLCLVMSRWQRTIDVRYGRNACPERPGFVRILSLMMKTEAIVPAAIAIGAVTGLPLPDPVPTTVMRQLPEIVQGLLKWIVFFNPLYGYIPWQAPYAFAAGIFTLLTVWGGIDRRRAILILPTSIVAWNVVFMIAIAMMIAFGPAASTSPKGPFEWILDWFAGLVSGFSGAALTAAGLCWISKRFRSRAFLKMTAITGALAGASLNAVHLIDLLRPHMIPVTFVIWQTSVAVAIAWQLSRQPGDIGSSRPTAPVT